MKTRNSVGNLSPFRIIKLFILLHFTCIKGAKVSSTYSCVRDKKLRLNVIPAEYTSIRRAVTAPIESEPATTTETSKFTIKTPLISSVSQTLLIKFLLDLISRLTDRLYFSSLTLIDLRN